MDESFQCLHAERELPCGEGSLSSQAAMLQSVQIFRQCVVWPIDDSQVFAAADFDRRLRQALAPLLTNSNGFTTIPSLPAAVNSSHQRIPFSCSAGSVPIGLDIQIRSVLLLTK